MYRNQAVNVSAHFIVFINKILKMHSDMIVFILVCKIINYMYML